MDKQKFPRLRAFITWIRRYLRTIIILGMFIFCIAVLMSHGKGFPQAVQDSYMLVSYFLSVKDGPDSDNSLAGPIAVGTLILVVAIAVYSSIKGESKK